MPTREMLSSHSPLNLKDLLIQGVRASNIEEDLYFSLELTLEEYARVSRTEKLSCSTVYST
jgi:hypothetical protein